MRIIKVIESKHWVNKVTGATASIYGAIPYTNETEKQNWEVKTRGWTWMASNGTIGIGRQPADTYESAIEIMNKINSL